MMDGTTVNVDVTAPGAIIALALMFLKVMFNIDNYEQNATCLYMI